MTEKEYNNCVNLYSDNVFRFILKNIRNEEDAKDVVQSAFEKLWLAREKVETETSKSYLFTIAYHQMIDLIRKNNRFSKGASLTNNEGFEKSMVDTRLTLNEALGKLNNLQRSLVMLKDYEGYHYAEIGEITGLSESQVRVYLHRARLQLRSYIVKPENVID